MPDKNTHDNKGEPEYLTLPFTDTVPGPGTIQTRVLHLNDKEIPTALDVERDNWIGAGTAEDVGSSLKAPVPGQELSKRGETR